MLKSCIERRTEAQLVVRALSKCWRTIRGVAECSNAASGAGDHVWKHASGAAISIKQFQSLLVMPIFLSNSVVWVVVVAFAFTYTEGYKTWVVCCVGKVALASDVEAF